MISSIHQWSPVALGISKYKWLIYSRQENGGYCLPCVLFARSTDVRKSKGALVEAVFNNFKKMCDVCDTHASREYHIGGVAAFVQVMSGVQESIAGQLREGVRETIQNNQKKLQSIIETIMLCGRICLCVVVVTLAPIWKVHNQTARTMSTSGPCSTSGSALEIPFERPPSQCC